MPPPMDDEEMLMPEEGMPAEMPPEDEGLDTDAAMAELDEAEKAGDGYAGKAFFAPVPGAEGDAGMGGEMAGADAGGASPEMQREVLEQILASLPS